MTGTRLKLLAQAALDAASVYASYPDSELWTRAKTTRGALFDAIDALERAAESGADVLSSSVLFKECCDGKLKGLYVARQRAVDALRAALK